MILPTLQIQSLKNLGLDITRAVISEGNEGKNRFYITDATARSLSAHMLAPVTAQTLTWHADERQDRVV